MQKPRLAYGLMNLLLAVAVLPACERPGQVESPQADEAATSASSVGAQGAPRQSADIAEPSVRSHNGVDKTCKATTFRITRSKPGESATTLQIVGNDGKASEIAKPREMGDYTAVGLGCGIAASDGNPYFIVQYGELPSGCAFCEWFYLYDAEGTQLTNSSPPLLTDESLPDGGQQTANTLEYERMLQKLGVEHPSVEYVR